MNKYDIWLSPPHMSGEETKYIDEAFATNWIAPAGKNIDDFERELEVFLKNPSKKVSLHSSGTAAIHLALDLLGVGKGDEVICQSLTFVATANPILYLGATPIFVGSEKETWNICPELLEQAIVERIKSGKKPKAIIVVHLYGMPCQYDAIKEIADNYEIPIVEDSAEALGSTYNEKYCGTLGDFGIISFNGNKIITASSGGALISNSQDMKLKAIKKSSQSKENFPFYQHSEIGYTYRLSNVLAGIGLGQMAVLEERVDTRKHNFSVYRENLKDHFQFQEGKKEMDSNRWLTCILCQNEAHRERIRQGLEIEKIESRTVWKPMHLQPIFQNKFPVFENQISELLFSTGLCLPSGSNLNDEQLGHILDTIKKYD